MLLEDLLPKASTLELVHPVSQEKLGIAFEVVGKDSKQFRTAWRATLKEMQGKKGAESDLLGLEKSNLMILGACIIGWNEGATEAFGKYTPERAQEVISMDELSFIKDQVEAFISERANFFRPSNATA